MSGDTYKLGSDYPKEGFVVQQLAQYFLNQGFTIHPVDNFLPKNKGKMRPDLICVKDETCWVVEAKGETSNIPVDFRSGVGALIQYMTNCSHNYAIAVPNTPKYITEIKKIDGWVRSKLNLFIFLVDEDGKVLKYAPSHVID